MRWDDRIVQFMILLWIMVFALMWALVKTV